MSPQGTPTNGWDTSTSISTSREQSNRPAPRPKRSAGHCKESQMNSSMHNDPTVGPPLDQPPVTNAINSSEESTAQPTTENTLLETALAYVMLGWYVLVAWWVADGACGCPA